MLKPQIILLILLDTVHVGFAVVAQALGLSGSQSKPYMVHSPNNTSAKKGRSQHAQQHH